VSQSATPPSSGPGLLDSLDDSKISRFQMKIMFVSGMGFFTDAYDLFVIGIVVYLLKTQWSLSTSQISLLNSITLLTITLLPGPKGTSLEELTEDAYAPPAVRRQEAPA